MQGVKEWLSDETKESLELVSNYSTKNLWANDVMGSDSNIAELLVEK